MKYLLALTILLLSSISLSAQRIGDHVSLVKYNIVTDIKWKYNAGDNRFTYDFSYKNGKIETINIYTTNGYDPYFRKPLFYTSFYVFDLSADTLWGYINSYDNVSLDELNGYMKNKYPIGNYKNYYFSRDGLSIIKVYLSEAGLATSMEFYGASMKLAPDVLAAWEKSTAEYKAYDEQKNREEEEEKKREEEAIKTYRNYSFDVRTTGDSKVVDEYTDKLSEILIDYYHTKIYPTYNDFKNSGTSYQEFNTLLNLSLYTTPDVNGKPISSRSVCTVLDGDSVAYEAVKFYVPYLPILQAGDYYVGSSLHYDSLTVHVVKGSVKIRVNDGEARVLNKDVPQEISTRLIALIKKEDLHSGKFQIDFVLGKVMGKEVIKYKKSYL